MHSDLSGEQLVAAMQMARKRAQAAYKRARVLMQLQRGLLVLCAASLLAGFSIKFMDGGSIYATILGLVGMLCGLGAVLAGRTIQSRAEETRRDLERFPATLPEERKDTQAIPLTIGFANLSGSDLTPIASEDIAILSPLFARSRVVADHQIPSAEILFVYAHLNEDGTIKGQTKSGIRQIVQLTNAAIVILASPNSAESIKNAAAVPGPKTANIVFTLDRNGNGFARFFRELFDKMRSGKDMLTAWVELAPQHPSANLPYAPQTIFVAEGGKIAFPH